MKENLSEDSEAQYSPDVDEFRTSIARFALPTRPTNVKAGTAGQTTAPSPLLASRSRTEESDDNHYDTLSSPSKRIRSTPTSPSKPPSKLSRKPSSKRNRGYAPAEKYAHLQPLTDYLSEDLDIMFCGINPGLKSAEVGHHFGNPRNHFWRCLHKSGLTEAQLLPEQDTTLPEVYNYGMTDLVQRPTADASELSNAEMVDSVPALLEKVALYRPRIVCFVGMGIGGVVARALAKMVQSVSAEGIPVPKQSTSVKGLLPYQCLHASGATRSTLFFVAPSTSGLAASYSFESKTQFFKDLKSILEQLKDGSLDMAALLPVHLPAHMNNSLQHAPQVDDDAKT